MRKTITKKIISIMIMLSVMCAITTAVFADETTREKFDKVVKDIQDTEGEIEDTKNKIAETNDELEKAQLSYNLQYQIAKDRIKYMYENSTDNILIEAFATDSLAEFNNRIEFFSNISKYDADILSQLKESQEKIETAVATLESEKKKLEDKKQELEDLKAEVEEQIRIEDELERQRMLAALQNAGINMATLGSESDSPDDSDGGSQPDSNPGTVYQSLPYNPSDAEIQFLAAVLESEAGGSNYEANLAVATVVCNRISSPVYPGTIYEVLVQPGQFSTVPGMANAALNRGVSGVSLQAAYDAVAGARDGRILNCIGFWSAGYAASKGKAGVNIGGNVFF